MIFANRLASYIKDGLFTHAAKWHQGPPIQACPDLRFIGIFDMVAQFGLLGDQNNFYDYTALPAWHTIAHAVALNEYR